MGRKTGSFDRIIDKIAPSSNTRGIDLSAAPSDSGQDRNRGISPVKVLEATSAELRSSMGLDALGTDARSEILLAKAREQAPKNFMDKTILRGTHWGVTELPGGGKFINPLKTLFSGLDWSMKNIGNPASSYVVGNFAQLLQQVTNDAIGGKIAREFQEAMGLKRGEFFSIPAAFSTDGEMKKFAESRSDLFWGEKFFTSILFDPTTYIGFGLYGKLPLAGKFLLGPLDTGITKSVELPFRITSRLYGGRSALGIPEYATYAGKSLGKVPFIGGKEIPALGTGFAKSNKQHKRLFAAQTFADVGEWMTEVTSGKGIKDIDMHGALRGPFEELMDMTRLYKDLTPAEKKMRDHLLGRHKMTVTEANQFINRVYGTKSRKLTVKDEGIQTEYFPLEKDNTFSTVARPLDGNIRYAMSDIRDYYVKGILSAEEANKHLSRILGFSETATSGKKLKVLLEGEVAKTQAVAKDLFAAGSPDDFRQAVMGRASQEFARDAANTFHVRMERLGLVGGIVMKFDKTQRKYWENGVSKAFVKPLSRQVLTFPLFPVQEYIETFIRQMTGASSRGYLSQKEILDLSTWYAAIPANLTLEGKGVANDIISASSRPGQLADVAAPSDRVFEELTNVMTKTGVEVTPDMVNKLKWLKPAHWVDAASAGSLAGRTHFVVDKAYQRMAGHLEVTGNSKLLSTVDFPENILPKDEAKRFQKDLVLAYYTAEPQAVRSILNNYTGETIKLTEFKGVIDKAKASGELHDSSIKLLESVGEKSTGRVGNLSEVFAKIEQNELDLYMKSAGGFGAEIKIVGDRIQSMTKHFENSIVRNEDGTIKHYIDGNGKISSSLPPDEQLAAINMVEQSMTAVDDANRRISGILQEATLQARFSVRTAKGKRTIVEQANAEIEKVMQNMADGMEKFTADIKALEEIAFTNKPSHLAPPSETFKNAWDDLQTSWSKDRAETQALFDTHKEDSLLGLQSFWDEYHNIRDSIWNGKAAGEGKLIQPWKDTQKAIMEQNGIKFPESVVDDLEFDGPITLQTLGRLLGGQGEEVSSSILSRAAFRNRADFIRVVSENTQSIKLKSGVTKTREELGITDEHIGKLYDQVRKAAGFGDEATKTFSSERGQRFQNLRTEVEATLNESSFQPAHEGYVTGKAEEVIAHLENLSDVKRAKLKSEGNRLMQGGVEDMKMNFVNYDDTSIIDDMMQHVFPFWTYEARRMPWLLQNSLSHPFVWNTFGAEGRYWDSTDDGYITPELPAGIFKGMQINPFGGTLLNAPRRLKKGDMQPEHIGGVRGAISSAEQQMAQGGFYFGPHMGLAFESVLTGDLAEGIGEAAPPPVTGTLSAMQWIAQKGGIKPFDTVIPAMRNAVMPERFTKYDTLKVLWDMGLNPAHVDAETWEPTANAAKMGWITQDEIDEARRKSAGIEWVKETTGMVRFRPETERNWRDAKDHIMKAWSGLDQEQLEELRAQKIPLTSVVPMHPQVSRMINELEGSDEMAASTAILSTGFKREIEDKITRYHETLEIYRDDNYKAQQSDNDLWKAGLLSPDAWRDRASQRKQAVASHSDLLRGRKRVTSKIDSRRTGVPVGETELLDADAEYADVPVTMEELQALQKKLGNDTVRLHHDVREELSRYYSITPRDDDGDGVVEWNDFYESREALVANLPPETREDVLFELDKNLTEEEKSLRDMQRGVLGDYWRIQESVAVELGVESLLKDINVAKYRDPETYELLKKTPQVRRFNKEVERRKEIMRTDDAQLDYALYIFGFTNKTKNLTARSWWEKGDGVLPRVPYIGYLNPELPENLQ